MALPQWAQSVTLRQFAAGSFVSGDFVPGAATDTSVQACVDSVSAHRLNQLPEGDRVKRVLSIVLETEVKAGDESVPRSADRIIVPGGTYAGTYEVHEVKVADEFGPLPHWEALLIGVEP